MSLYSPSQPSRSLSTRLIQLGRQRGILFGVILLIALLAFEVFNYSTTDYALTDLLGDLNFMGMRWSTILAIAFCGIDFAGIARLFTPGMKSDGITESWYLFGAWLLAATMNALLTWWGVSIAIVSHQTRSTVLMDAKLLFQVVPVFVAVMVWLIRILIIGSFSLAGDRLFNLNASANQRLSNQLMRNQPVPFQPESQPLRHPLGNQEPVRAPRPPAPAFTRPEPTYQSLTPRTAAPSASSIHHQQF